MLPQIFKKKIEALRLILRHSEGTSSQFQNGSVHSQTQLYWGCEGKGEGGWAGMEFLTTLCALYSAINAFNIEL